MRFVVREKHGALLLATLKDARAAMEPGVRARVKMEPGRFTI